MDNGSELVDIARFVKAVLFQWWSVTVGVLTILGIVDYFYGWRIGWRKFLTAAWALLLVGAFYAWQDTDAQLRKLQQAPASKAASLGIEFDVRQARLFYPDGRTSLGGDPLRTGSWEGNYIGSFFGKYVVAKRENDSVTALAILTKMEETDPSFFYVDYYRAVYLERLNRPKEAARARERVSPLANAVLKAAPEHPFALFVKAFILLKGDETSDSDRVLAQISDDQIPKVMEGFVDFPVLTAASSQRWKLFFETFYREHNLPAPAPRT